MKGLGGTAFGVLGSTGLSVASTTAVDDRFVVDTSDARPGWRDGVEIIHELPPIDAAVVRASETQLEGVRATEDTRIRVDPPATSGVTVTGEEIPTSHEGTSQPPGYYLYQWDKYAQDLRAVHQTATGRGARVGIIDTGTDLTHQEFADNGDFEASKNFTDDGEGPLPVRHYHGTHVGGIAAAGGVIATGTAPDATVVSLRVFSGPFARTGDIIAAIVYSAVPRGADVTLVIAGEEVTGGAGCDVSNLSIGAYPVPEGIESKIYRDLYERGAAFANELGTVLVASAGNDGVNLDEDGDVFSFPNEADGFISISATGPIGFRWDDSEDLFMGDAIAEENLIEATTEPAFYTNYGAEATDLSAAGGDADLDAVNQGGDEVRWYLDLVFNAAPGNSYTWAAGTSMSAPQVTGAVALIKSLYPDATPTQVFDHLQATADQIGVRSRQGTSEDFRGADGGHLDLTAVVSTSLGETSDSGPVFSEPIRLGDEEIGPPRDLDGDGLHEDVTGDGNLDEEDARALYRIVTWPSEFDVSLSASQVAALDFDGDGELTHTDAQALLRMARSNEGGSS